MVVEYYIDLLSYELTIKCFNVTSLNYKPHWSTVTWWLVPGTFSYD